MANAMQYSLMTRQRVELPMDPKVYAKYLKQLIAKSTYVKKTDAKGSDDLNGSFNNK